MKTKTIKVKKVIEVDGTVKIVEFIDFVRFLADTRCISNFFHNFDNDNSDYFRAHTPSEWLSGAFSWAESPEGGSYWVNIDNEWMNFLHLHHITEGTYLEISPLHKRGLKETLNNTIHDTERKTNNSNY